ncbi:DEAD-domain-containing protein [Jaminaea rosea]|uniref:ATP-dependent RNA helicase n=1 Tax=Jaminaea rosea TaxID=1569628 RepID=A0A316UYU0_9BASI|nr:DEAD-domain-containing protein [Jaminaea rosea]PWN29958.1 DEAD-domain-containing protein [Jaminaea rosea]
MAAPSASGPPFSSLKPLLAPWLLDHLTALGFSRSTPVQASTLPLVVQRHKDVIVEAVTGSGKTLAYLVPLLEMARAKIEAGDSLDRGIHSLVILPTRELAIQVFSVLQGLLASAPSDFREALIPQLLVGGSSTQYHTSGRRKGVESGDESEDDGIASVNTAATDYARFRRDGSNVLIGTPGRVEELLSPGKRGGKVAARQRCKTVELLVLDEADRLLDLGFMQSLTTIVGAMPSQRRTALFSATMSDAMTGLVRLGLRNPVRVTVKVEAKPTPAAKATQATEDAKAGRTPSTLSNYFLITPHHLKLAQLIRLLRYEAQEHAARKIIVFFATCSQVEYFYRALNEVPALRSNKTDKMKLFSLHGKQDPKRRSAVYRNFVDEIALPSSSSSSSSTSSTSILLSTDVASRGLDLPNVDLVVQYDPPLDPKVFQHRIGRTARAGRPGRAVCLLAKGAEESYIDFLKLRGVKGERYGSLQEQDDGKVERVQVGSQEDHDASSQRLTNALRNACLSDRGLHDSLVLALVSYLRAYGKHEARFVFPLKALVDQVEALARSWGAVRLPRLGELKERDAKRRRKAKGDARADGEGEEGEQEVVSEGAPPGADEAGYLDGSVDEKTWSYKDAAKETARLAKLEAAEARRQAQAQQEANGEAPSTSSNVAARKRMRLTGDDDATTGAWSDQKKRKERKEERRVKKGKKREAIWRAKKEAEEAEEAQKKAAEQGVEGGESGEDDDDADAWAEEEREVRREKRAKRREKARKAGERGARRQRGDAKESDDDAESEGEFGMGDASSGEDGEVGAVESNYGGFFDDL